ncbi:hypothetical protein [Dictyobacter kobayashii]|uniref:Uncharacterized protein n=1 Tax=Dictyobacter kobayashii TaxID=2014872 RepID=A0A402AK12_9CHLR|nr:hypothetical protein [Dictyobacter kobayashii]GCE19380.1 hypothetical protein KDK_31800 [Dictyobacter kobayashii]
MSIQNSDSSTPPSQADNKNGCLIWFVVILLLIATIKIYPLTLHPLANLDMILAYLALPGIILLLLTPWAKSFLERFRPNGVSALVVGITCYFITLVAPFSWKTIVSTIIIWLVSYFTLSSRSFQRLWPYSFFQNQKLQRGELLIAVSILLAFMIMFLVIGGTRIYAIANQQPVDYIQLFMLIALLILLPAMLVFLSWCFAKNQSRSGKSQEDPEAGKNKRDTPRAPHFFRAL